MAENQTIKMNPVTIGALVGGVIAFVAVGAIVSVLWVAFGAVIGGALGVLFMRFTGRAKVFAEAVELKDSTSKEELYEEARKLGIEGRSQMDKDQLVQAITERRTSGL